MIKMNDIDKLEQYVRSMLPGLSIAYEACTDMAFKNKIYGSIAAYHEILEVIKDIRKKED